MVSIFIKTYQKDFPWLKYCLESIEKFVTGYDEIIIVFPEEEQNLQGLKFPPKTAPVWIKEYGNPYLFQQVVKLDANYYTESKYIMFVDSDCIFTKPVNLNDLVIDERPLILYTPYEKVGDAICWKSCTEKILEREVKYEFMRRFPLLYHRDTLINFKLFVAEKFNQSVEEYVMSQDRFSEFNALGAFAFMTEQSKYRWLDTETLIEWTELYDIEHIKLPEPIAIQFWSHSGLTKEDLRRIYEVLYPEIEFTEEGHAIVKGDTHIGEWVKQEKRLDFDQNTLPAILPMFKPGMTVIDVGANIGCYSYAFAECVKGSTTDGTVLCFEPNPVAFKALKYNLHGMDNVVLFEKGVGNSESKASIIENPNTGASYLAQTANGTDDVHIVPLDNLNINHVDIIKLDCEGWEWDSLAGAASLIKRCYPHLVVEINKGALDRRKVSVDRVFDVLKYYGYTCKNIYPEQGLEGDQFDILCIHKSKLDMIMVPEKTAPKEIKKCINFKHMGNAGDIIYALSGIKTVCEKLDMKANIYLWIDRPAHYYEGAYHPTRNFKGQQVSLNHYMAKMLIPLLQYQPFINEVKIWEGEEIHCDLDKIKEVNVNMPYGDIRKWYSYVFTFLHCDLGEKILSDPPMSTVTEQGYIVVNRTQRYYNPMISYMFLRNYPKVFFAGTPEEFELFQHEVPSAAYLQCDDFLELSAWIAGARVVIGNQSMCFAIAEQLKVPRILETCKFAPNVHPVGKNAYDFYTQSAFEEYVKMLME